MRKIIIVFLAIMFQQTFAQEQTLISSSEYSSGGFGAPVLKYTTLNDQGSMLIGGRGGWIINHSLILGGGIYGLATNVTVDVIDGDMIYPDADKLHLMYGGFEFEYIFSPLNVFHISLYALLGAGNVFYLNIFEENQNMGKTFFVAEPAINFEVNVTNYFHLAAGVSYRYTNGANYQAISDPNVSGFNGMLTFKFGKF